MSTAPPQRDRDWIATAEPEEVRRALEAGELADILHGAQPSPTPEPEPVGDPDQGARGPKLSIREQLRQMTPEQVRDMHAAGHLDLLMKNGDIQ